MTSVKLDSNGTRIKRLAGYDGCGNLTFFVDHSISSGKKQLDPFHFVNCDVRLFKGAGFVDVKMRIRGRGKRKHGGGYRPDPVGEWVLIARVSDLDG